MKKKVLFLVAAMALCGSSLMVSCKKSNADVIKEYRELCDEVVEAANSGDLSKSMEVAKKAQKFEEENKDREFTPEEQQEMADISMKMFNAM